jgi:Glyoxalase-like domain
VPVDPPLSFSRPVDLPDGPRDAAFRTVTLASGTATVGRLYFCHHLTRDLVWRDEWRHHPNGVIGIARAVIAAEDPSVLAALFARMFGPDALHPIEGGHTLNVGLSRFDIVSHERLRHLFGDAAPDGGGRPEFMAALSFRVTALDRTAAALAAGGIAGVRREEQRIVVPAASACGAALEFVA